MSKVPLINSNVGAAGGVLPHPRSTSQATARVLHVVNGEHYSGAERVQDLLAEHLPAARYEVGLACVKPGRFAAARQCSTAPLYELPMRGRWDLGCGDRVARLVCDERYDLLHAHTPRSLMVAARAASKARVPLVYHVHSPAGRDSTRRLANRVNQWIETRTARRALRLIAVSPSVRQYMLDQGFAEHQVIYVPNGVPVVAVQPRVATPPSWTLGMAALFRPRKGIEVLLEALAQVRRTGADVRLRAIGPFETAAYEADVKQLVDRLELGAAVTWTGFVTDVAAELAAIDVSVLPSLFGEGLPMVVLEAMAAGVPVIASRVEGIPEAVRHGEEGLLVEAGDAGDLARAMGRLVRGEVDYPALSAAAQERHRDCFSAHAMARDVANVYDEILGA